MSDIAPVAEGGLMDSVISPFRSLQKNHFLISQLIKRNWAARYKGTVVGILWLVLRPILLLVAFVFIRGIILRGRIAPVELEGLTPNLNIAVFLCCGLIFFFFSAEILQRAPNLILGRRGYVKRLVFPLETFAFVAVGASVLPFVVTYILLTLTLLYGGVGFSLQSLLIIVLLVPLAVLWCGVLWLVSSVGVYLRDFGQFTSLLVMSMLFLGPVFYSLEDVPEEFRSLMYINPITFPVTQTRRLIMEGQMLDWAGLGKYALASLVIFYLGYFVFNRLRRGFADVL
jgi:lipopolysaccharide transport system permease protein